MWTSPKYTGIDHNTQSVNINSWDVRGWCSDKKQGIFLSVDLFKEKKTNQQIIKKNYH